MVSFRLGSLLKALLIALASAICLSASAASGSARLSAIRLEVVDLDLNDGIVASVVLQDQVDWIGPVQVSAQVYDGLNHLSTQIFVGPRGGALVAAVDYDALSAHAYTTAGDLLLPNSSVEAFASTLALRTGGMASSQAWGLYSKFLLTPNSGLVLTAFSEVSGFAAVGEEVSSSAIIGLYSDAAGPSDDFGYLFIDRAGTISGVLGASDLRVSISNRTAESWSGTVSAIVQSGSVSAVPEPAAVLLLLVGLFQISLVACRRNPQIQ